MHFSEIYTRSFCVFGRGKLPLLISTWKCWSQKYLLNEYVIPNSEMQGEFSKSNFLLFSHHDKRNGTNVTAEPLRWTKALFVIMKLIGTVPTSLSLISVKVNVNGRELIG